MVWSPYEFWVDGKTSHCSVDVFDFVRVSDEWRVANSMWIVEPDAGRELRPLFALRIEGARRLLGASVATSPEAIHSLVYSAVTEMARRCPCAGLSVRRED